MLKDVKLIYQRKCSNCNILFQHLPGSNDYYCPDCKRKHDSKKNRMRRDRKSLSPEYKRKRDEFLKHYYATTNHEFTRRDLIITKINR